MAITKMKFISACTDRSHLDEMLLTGVHSGMLHAEPASEIITDENGGKLISEENPYAGYLQTLRNFCHTVGYEPKVKEHADQEYDGPAIEAFLKELNDAFAVDSDSKTMDLSKDDEKALDALSACDFERMSACQYLNFGFGRLPLESFKKLSMYSGENFVIHRLLTSAQYCWLVYVTSDTYAGATAKIFESLFFEPIAIPRIDVKRLLSRYQQKIDDLYTFCSIKNELYKLHHYVLILNEKHVLAGFVQADQVEAYKAKFAGLPVDFRVKEPSQVPQCTPPTLLKNGWFARPFELYIDMYGLPAYDDFDPTLFVAVTYCILFGIMFGDLGQGLILVLLGLIMEAKGKGRLWGIIGRVGITSMVFGFLFGSVFGYEDALNPIHQSLFHVREKLFDVMSNSNTMPLLLGAMGIGAVLILTTMVMNIINNARHKRWGEVLFSQNGVAGFLFYGFLLVCMAKVLISGDRSLLTPAFIIPFLAVPAVCFLLKEPLSNLLSGKGMKPNETWGGYITESIFEVLEIILSFVTNSMSYLRVGGFVLSHAGMMVVVMTLVKMTGSGGIVTLIIGNLFVMILEGMIVGIQALRLEYYEMFSRYYTGGGKKYQALTAAEA
jgi:V/A-type H+-transporting ATPase subunit I